MNMSGLSFNGLPPIDIPFRFFVTAISFVIGLAFFVFFSGESLWLSRWHPSMLALTHGFTLGVITPVMMGALLQMLPVVGGIGVKNARRVGLFCHPLHFIGTILLMWGFVSTNSFQPVIKMLAISCLVLSFAYYIFAIAGVLLQYFRQQLGKNIFSQNPTVVAIGYSILALLVTVVIGIILQSQSIGVTFFSITNTHKILTNIHALWGGIGWMSVLIIAVSLQVIPMFHVAPSFPKVAALMIPFLLLVCLALMLIFPLALESLLSFVLLIFLMFNLLLLKVIWQRKRKIPDTTINYWRLGVITFIMIALFYFCPDNWLPAQMLISKNTLLIAAFIYLYLLSIIQGMLIKILPFLSYTHLQQRCLVNFNAMQFLPNMHELLNKKMANALFYCHVFTGGALLVTVINPEFYWFFSACLLLEFSLFLIMMIGTCRVYCQSSLKIKQVRV